MDSGQTSDGDTNRQHGSCVWINLLRSMYREILRYFESRFQSHEGIFYAKCRSVRPIAKGAQNPKSGCARPSQKSVSDRGSGKAPIRILTSFATERPQFASPVSRQTPHKYNEISDYGKWIFVEMELRQVSEYNWLTDDTGEKFGYSISIRDRAHLGREGGRGPATGWKFGIRHRNNRVGPL
jgi:hypothetical protein